MSTSNPSSTCSPPLPRAPPKNLLAFYHLLTNLKTTKRTGWVNKTIPSPESIADHMYRVALISLSLTSDPHAIKLALAHDIAEAIVGDITPHDGVSKEVKHELERKAMLHICFDVVSGEFGQELWELWNEYELGETECAKLVKDVDKFEMLVQAEEYERMGYKLGEFFDGVEGKLNTDCVKEMDMALRKEREERRSRS